MQMNPRTDAVRASLRLPRALLATGLAVFCVLLVALAGVLLATPNSTLLLMNVERVNHLRDVETVIVDRSISPAPAEQPSRQKTVSAEENIRWQSDEVRYFNGRPIRPVKTLTMTVTAYSPDERSCGKWADGITASGYSVWTNGMKLVAADTRILPFGSLISVPGYDNASVVPVLDRGGAIKGKRLDVLYPTHERALQWGVQELEVTVWDYADGGPNDFRTNHRRR